MRVLFLTHYYPPELGAAPARIAALAHGLSERGVEVTVHTGFPHYPSGSIAPPYRNRPVRVERDGPVRIVRSVVLAAPNRGLARRLADHAAFAAGAVTFASATGQVDVVVAESPPLFTAVAGVAYARMKRAALALNVSDLWPESAVELGALSARGRAASTAAGLARFCYRSADLITAPTRGIVETLSTRPESAGKAVRVPPAVDLERFASVATPAVDPERSASVATPAVDPERSASVAAPAVDPERSASVAAPAVDPERSASVATLALPPDARLRVLYAGTLGIAQGLHTLVQAAALAGPHVVELLIAGDGPERERLHSLVRAGGLTNVHLIGPVPPGEIPAVYGSVDAGVVPLRDLPIFAGALPTKLFEVLAAGRPAIVAARGEAAALVRDAGAGLVVDPEDPQALAQAFRHLRASPTEILRMGARGRDCVRSFDRTVIVAQWHTLLAQLTASHP